MADIITIYSDMLAKSNHDIAVLTAMNIDLKEENNELKKELEEFKEIKKEVDKDEENTED